MNRCSSFHIRRSCAHSAYVIGKLAFSALLLCTVIFQYPSHLYQRNLRFRHDMQGVGYDHFVFCSANAKRRLPNALTSPFFWPSLCSSQLSTGSKKLQTTRLMPGRYKQRGLAFIQYFHNRGRVNPLSFHLTSTIFFNCSPVCIPPS